MEWSQIVAGLVGGIMVLAASLLTLYLTTKASERAEERAETGQMKPTCPSCGLRDQVRPIVRGYPTPALSPQAERGEVVLGGCMVVTSTRSGTASAAGSASSSRGPRTLPAW